MKFRNIEDLPRDTRRLQRNIINIADIGKTTGNCRWNGVTRMIIVSVIASIIHSFIVFENCVCICLYCLATQSKYERMMMMIISASEVCGKVIDHFCPFLLRYFFLSCSHSLNVLRKIVKKTFIAFYLTAVEDEKDV